MLQISMTKLTRRKRGIILIVVGVTMLIITIIMNSKPEYLLTLMISDNPLIISAYYLGWISLFIGIGSLGRGKNGRFILGLIFIFIGLLPFIYYAITPNFREETSHDLGMGMGWFFLILIWTIPLCITGLIFFVRGILTKKRKSQRG